MTAFVDEVPKSIPSTTVSGRASPCVTDGLLTESARFVAILVNPGTLVRDVGEIAGLLCVTIRHHPLASWVGLGIGRNRVSLHKTSDPRAN